MVYDKANELAKLLKESDEFREYKTTKEKAFENDTTASLIKEYHKFQKIGELLQLNQDASAFLFAEYRLNRVVSDIYKIIAEAIDDASPLLQRLRNSSVESSMPSSTSNSAISSTSMPSRIFTFTVFLGYHRKGQRRIYHSQDTLRGWRRGQQGPYKQQGRIQNIC